MVKGIQQGWNNNWPSLESKVKSQVSNLVKKVNSELQIHSPSKVFAKIGKNMALGMGEGWTDTFEKVSDDIVDDMGFVGLGGGYGDTVETYTVDTGTMTGTASGSNYATEQITNITINIDGAQIQNDRQLAETIAEQLQNLVDRRAAVWA